MVYVHLEQGVSLIGDTKIQSLSWMGKVPDMLPNEDGLKLDRDLYYQEGWLASGNGQGVVGVTFTSCHGVRSIDSPHRTNYNLTGHHSQVIMVSWNEPYQKLVTCDEKGVIFVWIRHEGRWSIELINDRHHKVTDFSWSHDGRMAMICYQDGFMLVGSVGGQRYWSSMLNLEESHITAGVWTPDDTKILLGTSAGHVIVMGSTGTMLNQFELIEGMEISSMAWSCEKFNMEEAEDEADENERARSRSPIDDCCKSHMLAISFKYGAVLLMSNYDDVDYKTVHTGLVGLKMEWSNDGDLLACGGFVRQANLDCDNIVKLYCKDGNLKKVIHIPTQVKALSALTWGHSDRRLFISAGNCIYVAWVTKTVPTLQMMCRDVLKSCLPCENALQKLPLPVKVRQFVKEAFDPTVQGVIPSLQKLRDFVIMPPVGTERYYCTMIKHDSDSNGDYWTLYLEHLGGLFPLLKARKSSKLRPEFVIFDPVPSNSTTHDSDDANKSGSELSSFDSDTDAVDMGCGSPKSQRKNKDRRRRRRLEKLEKESVYHQMDTKSSVILDGLPEKKTIVEVASNIWGTKFRIIGCAPYLPRDMGQIVYKSSLLHLQPRQMSLAITEITKDDGCHGYDSQSSLYSEQEDEVLSPSAQTGLVSGHEEHFVIVPEETHAQPTFADVECAETVHNEVFLLPGTMHCGEVVVHAKCDKNIQCDGTGNISSGAINQLETDSLLEKCGDCAETDSSSKLSESAEFYTAPTSLDSDLVSDSGLHSCQGAIPKNVPSKPQAGDHLNGSMGHLNGSNGHLNGYPVERKVRLQSRAKECAELKRTCRRCSGNGSATLCSLCRSDYGSLTKPDDNGKFSDNMHITSHAFQDDLKFIDEDSDNDDDDDEIINIGSTSSVPAQATTSEIRKFEKAVGIWDRVEKKPSASANFEKKSLGLNGFTPASERNNSKNVRNSKFTKQGSVGATEILSTSDGTGASPSASPSKKDTPKCHSWLREPRLGYSSQSIESSDDEILLSGDELTTSYSYRDLESFQKAQLRLKMRKSRSKSDGERVVPRKQFIMHNKAPLWNENSQVYQLDFGGRVTQESAKNFQIEFRGKQVMQFGRIDLNKYTLDFQYPFSGIQAFAVALANVTQRLK